jgi:hypothetical protein
MRDGNSVLGNAKADELSNIKKQRPKFSYNEFRKRIIFTYLWHTILKEVSIKDKDLTDLINRLDEEYVFNLYAKMINVFGIVEFLSVGEAREGLKKYFEAMSNDLGVFALENKLINDMNYEDDSRIDNSSMLSIKDINWKLVNIMTSNYEGNINNFSQVPDPKENLAETLDAILGKDRFFEKTSMAFPIRFAVFGGSKELQILCQNFGNLFEVARSSPRFDLQCLRWSLSMFTSCRSENLTLPTTSLRKIFGIGDMCTRSSTTRTSGLTITTWLTATARLIRRRKTNSRSPYSTWTSTTSSSLQIISNTSCSTSASKTTSTSLRNLSRSQSTE